VKRKAKSTGRKKSKRAKKNEEIFEESIGSVQPKKASRTYGSKSRQQSRKRVEESNEALPTLQKKNSEKEEEVYEENEAEFDRGVEHAVNEELESIVTEYKKYTLKQINLITIKNLLKSDDESLRCFGTKLCNNSEILDHFVTVISNQLKLQPVQTQIKNVGVLHKLVKGLQRCIELDVPVSLTPNFSQTLSETSNIDGLPQKTVQRITELLGATDTKNPARKMSHNTLKIPLKTEVDWLATILGEFGRKKERLEDEFDCKIRLIGEGSGCGNEDGDLRLEIWSYNHYNGDRCRDRLHKFVYEDASNYVLKSARQQKKWQQVLDKKTGAYYYWNVDDNKVRWEAPAEGFEPYQEDNTVAPPVQQQAPAGMQQQWGHAARHSG